MKPTPNIDWKKSPAHIDLLSKFTKPRDITQVLNWQYLKDSIKEKPQEAISRFIRDGALIPCSIEEILECTYKVSQLQKFLKERDLPQKGNKSDLVERLVATDHRGMEGLTKRLSVMKCSESGLRLVEEYEQAKQRAIDVAKQQSYEALLGNRLKEAYKTYIAFQRQYTDPRYPSGGFEVEEMEFVLSSRPKVLSNISPENLGSLRAAICMSILWQDEPVINWIPISFHTHLKSNEVAANYLRQNAKIREELARIKEYSEQVKVTFYSNDIDSCELCLALNGKVIDIKNFPDLPFEGCKSDFGCKCDLRYPDEEDEEELDDGETDDLENIQVGPDLSDERETAAKVGQAEGDEVVDFEMTGGGDNLSERAGFILKFGDGSMFEFYYQHPVRHIVDNYAKNNAAKRFFDEVNELTDKFKWNLKNSGKACK
jgi:hypothetical protein